MALIFILISGIFWGANLEATGDWNYQGGVRKSFYGDGGFPLEKENLTFETAAGSQMTSEGYSEKHLLPPRIFIYNFFYYFFGRFSGIIWYFFPAVLALILFIVRKKQLYQWFILGALTLEILTYIILMPDNYAGGAGALGNRYFLCIYPLFFFLVDFKENTKEIGINWIVASVFISQILLSPLQHSHFPSTHTAKFPFKILPVELTLINNYPTSTNPNARSQKVGTEGSWLFFLDNNYLPRTVTERKNQVFITRGPHITEMILKTAFPLEEITFTLKNNQRLNNNISVKFAGEKKSIVLGREEQGTLTFKPKKAFRMSENIYLYKLSVKADKASIPYFEVQESGEKRYLGVSFWLEPVGQ
jgi:hypothetical protein